MIITKTLVLGYRNIKTHKWQKYSFQMGKLTKRAQKTVIRTEVKFMSSQCKKNTKMQYAKYNIEQIMQFCFAGKLFMILN